MTVDECAKRMLDHFAPAIEEHGLPAREGIKAADAVLGDLYALIRTVIERCAAIADADRAVTGDKPTAASRIAEKIRRTSQGKGAG